MNDIERLAKFMLDNEIATGHGDTFDDLLNELQRHLTERWEAQKSADKTYQMRRFIDGAWDGNMPSELISGKDAQSAAESRLGIPLSPHGEPEQLCCEVWNESFPIKVKQFYYP